MKPGTKGGIIGGIVGLIVGAGVAFALSMCCHKAGCTPQDECNANAICCVEGQPCSKGVQCKDDGSCCTYCPAEKPAACSASCGEMCGETCPKDSTCTHGGHGHPCGAH